VVIGDAVLAANGEQLVIETADGLLFAWREVAGQPHDTSSTTFSRQAISSRRKANRKRHEALPVRLRRQPGLPAKIRVKNLRERPLSTASWIRRRVRSDTLALLVASQRARPTGSAAEAMTSKELTA